MKYSIVYDKPQRIRFRCGAYAFDKAYEGCIYNFLIEKNYVKKVEVNSENGGIENIIIKICARAFCLGTFCVCEVLSKVEIIMV